MKSVAFVTYKTIGETLPDGRHDGPPSGWHDGPENRRALLIQNDNCGKSASDAKSISHARDEIGNLWGRLREALPHLDCIVIYVGLNGLKRVIALATQLPPSKVTFVCCECDLPMTEAMIQAAGMATARRLLCECGGYQTMERLYRHFLKTGELAAPEE